jgi:hypothetical protein
MSNTDLWDKLGRTDPKHTKGFSRAGGFKGTAIKPMWAFRRMTEEFGACGIGWGINQPAFQVVPSGDGETLVYCTVSIWHGSRDQIVFGVGGDKVVSKRRDGGSFSDDEAFKKSFTDAITNALKLIGVGADVHMGCSMTASMWPRWQRSFPKSRTAAALDVRSISPKRRPRLPISLMGICAFALGGRARSRLVEILT